MAGSVHEQQEVVDVALTLLVASSLLIFASGLLAWPLARLAGAKRQAFLPCIMFGNVGPVGLPLTVLAFGEAGLVPAVLLLVLSNILHFTVGVWIMSGQADLKSVFLSPLVWSTVLGLAFSLLRFRLPEWVDVTLTMIGNILIPMMLLSLGARLAESEATRWRAGVVGALATPVVRAIAAVVLLQFLPLDGIQHGALFCLRRFLQPSSTICSPTALAATRRGSRPSSWPDIWRALLFCRWR